MHKGEPQMPIAPCPEVKDPNFSLPELDPMPDRASVLMPDAPPVIHYDSVVEPAIPPEAARPHEIESATRTDIVRKQLPESARTALFRLSAWCVGLFADV